MPADAQPFQYAMLRLVPRVERGEGFNVGVVVFCRPLEFLGARTHLDAELLARFAPGCDAGPVAERLAAIERVAAGAPDAGAIAQLTISERFHFLVAPASTMVQASPAHTGMTSDPAAQLDRLFAQLVER